MNRDQFDEFLFEAVPALRDLLHFERVDYQAGINKALFTFTADCLVESESFSLVRKAIRKAFPQLDFSLRIASPSLSEDFLEHPEKYGGILKDILLRTHPGISSWADEWEWSSEHGALILKLPDSFSLEYAQDKSFRDRLAAVILDLFRIRPPISLRLKAGSGPGHVPVREGIEGKALPPGGNLPASEKKPEPPPLQAHRDPGKKTGERLRRIKGGPVTGQPSAISTLNELSGKVIVFGRVVSAERRDIPGKEMVLVSFVLTDYTGSVNCKTFLRYRSGRRPAEGESREATRQEMRQLEEKVLQIRQDAGLKVRGDCQVDAFDKTLVLMAQDITQFDWPVRTDAAPEKRIELHAHTQMSAMDGVVPTRDLIARAAKWGHKAIAITDYGVVQAFPEAFAAAKEWKIRLIPGIEAYMIDSADIVRGADDRALSGPIVVLDFETTGLNTKRDRIIEIGAVRMTAGKPVDSFSMLVNPGVPLSPAVSRITKISDSDLLNQPDAAAALPKLLEFIGGDAVAAHNADFDCAILGHELDRIGLRHSSPQIDTLVFAQKLYPNLQRYRLSSVCKHLGVSLRNAHRAVHDATATAQCLQIMLEEMRRRGAENLKDIDRYAKGYVKTDVRHVTVIAASQAGMVNLNRLVSVSHLEHFHRMPKIPREVILAHREGLLIGSACGEGEVFQAVMNGASPSRLFDMARFYDYLEIQPVANHVAYIHNGQVSDRAALEEINRKIVELGEKAGLPVVATGDVHCLEPEDAAFRAVLRHSQHDDEYSRLPPLHFMTTGEMLEEFSAYLGEEKAREVVVDNPRTIVDRLEEVSLYPKHPEGKTTFSPSWEQAAEEIAAMAAGNARRLYGEPLPDIVDKRLKRELKSIISYNYATLYSIANKLVTKSVADGYPVGSRGSVGSSLVATLCEITEVNPLPPHYRCPACRASIFDVPEGCAVGADLPDRDCPLCGARMAKDGYDIPFEVFLGFKGDKVPDIDLNFSGVYQPTAHAYVEELFGKGFVFRAGTIGTLQEKTAYGLVRKYASDSGMPLSEAEMNRLATGCVGVKRTTGQHPGGIVILPKEYEINQFTAVQHPADDTDSSVVTTHYDFNSMHDILVKLDILGHDDPTMIHNLEELTGISYRDIPLDDKKVLSLFLSPEALGVTEEEIGCKTGTLAVPEFGTPFVRQILLDTKPTTMEELIRIAGLSHGTDVWLGNAKELIEIGKASLRNCICTRDDIMNYLISVGVQAKTAFDTMENVRKGKKLKPEMEAAMRERKVPDWFIDSCRKIGYMFPKGHAVAYVIMALRVAWFKLYHPLPFYASYFSIRGAAFDAQAMLKPAHYIRSRVLELSAADSREMSGREKDELVTLEIVLEMLSRGFSFLPPDLYASGAKEFLIENGALRAPLTALNGFGEAAALSISQARDEPFVSVEDLKRRTRITAAGIDMLRAAGALDRLSQTDQVDFFHLI